MPGYTPSAASPFVRLSGPMPMVSDAPIALSIFNYRQLDGLARAKAIL